MNWLDIVIIIVVAIATIIGLSKGIIRMVLTVVGLVVGIIVAGRYYTPFSEYLTFISPPGWAKVAAFAIILIGIMVAAALLSRLLERASSAVMLGWANRLVGAILGFLLGALLIGAILAIWVKYIGTPGAIEQSRLAPILLSQFPRVLALLPDEFDAIRSFFN
jgi:membrane protein required for colicin V production